MADTKTVKLEVLMAAVDRLTGPLNAMVGNSQRMVDSMRAARLAVKDLEDQQKKLDKFTKARTSAHEARDAYNKQKEALVDLNKKYEESRKKQADMIGTMKNARAEHKALMAAFANNDATPGLSNKLYVAKQNLEKLEAQYGKVQSATKSYKGEITSATQALERAKDAKHNWHEALVRTRKALREVGGDTHKLTAFQEQLKAKTAEATAAAEKQGKVMERMHAARANYEKSMAMRGKALSAGITAGATGAATVAPVVKTVADYSKFEDAMLGVARQVDGARDDNGKLTKTYYDMAQEIKRLSTTIPLATVEIAKIVEAGARMGIQGKENLIEFAKTTALTATAFNLPVDHIGEQMGKLAQLYKIPIPAISTLGDTINWLDDNALSKGGDIIDVMQRIAGTATGVNMAAKEAAALGSTFLSLGSRAEVAATASNAMIRELSIATMQPKRFQEGIKALGLSAQGLQMGMPKDATGTILMVLDKLKALPSDKRLEVATRIFGKEYGDDAAKLAENLDEYRRQLKLVNEEKAKGSMKREGDARNDTLSAGGQIVKNKFFNLTSAIGETQRETVAQIGQSIGNLLDRITAFVQANPGFVGAVVKIVAVMGGLLAVFGTIALAAAAILGPFAMAKMAMTTLGISGFTLGGAMGTVLGALKGIALFMFTNPIGIFITVIVAAAALIWANWDKLGPKFWALWDGIKSAFSSALKWITDFIMNWTIVGFIVEHWEDLKAITLAIWDRIKAGIAAIGQGILNFFLEWTLLGVIVRHWDDICAGADTAWQIFQKIITTAGQAIADFFFNWTVLGLIIKHWDDITQFMGTLSDKFFTIGGQIMDGLVNGFIGGVTALKNAINGVGDSAIGWMKEKLGIKSPSRVFAEIGGHLMGGLTMGIDDGEDGPLARIKAITDKITAAGAGMAIGMGAGGAMAAPITIDTRPPITASAMAASQQAAAAPNITITVNAAPGMDEAALARLVAAEVEKATRQKQVAKRSRLTDGD